MLDYSSYYQTDEQADAAANALYIQLKGSYYNYAMLKNALSDDVWAGGGDVMTMLSSKDVMSIPLVLIKALSEGCGRVIII